MRRLLKADAGKLRHCMDIAVLMAIVYVAVKIIKAIITAYGTKLFKAIAVR